MAFDSVLKDIRNGGQETLLAIYRQHRNEFLTWASFHYSCSEAEAKDVFQDSVIVFYENVKNGRLTYLTCDLKTYIFGIGKYKLLNLEKKNARMVTLDDAVLINGSDNSLEMQHDKDHNRQIVQDNLNKLPEKDREILRLYYIEGLDMKTIANKLGYKNADVAKKRKYEVFKKLALLVKNNLRTFMLL